MPRPCDGCRYCPTTYPSRGATGDEVERSPDFGWGGDLPSWAFGWYPLGVEEARGSQ